MEMMVESASHEVILIGYISVYWSRWWFETMLSCLSGFLVAGMFHSMVLSVFSIGILLLLLSSHLLFYFDWICVLDNNAFTYCEEKMEEALP